MSAASLPGSKNPVTSASSSFFTPRGALTRYVSPCGAGRGLVALVSSAAAAALGAAARWLGRQNRRGAKHACCCQEYAAASSMLLNHHHDQVKPNYNTHCKDGARLTLTVTSMPLRCCRNRPLACFRGDSGSCCLPNGPPGPPGCGH